MNGELNMRTEFRARDRERGVMLIEALIAILIFSIGILAVVGMQGIAIKNVTTAKYRSEAAFLADALLAQMWADNGNIAAYNYSGTGGAPLRLTDWIAEVNKRLPNAATVPPIVTVPAPLTPAPTALGATVEITVRWLEPEEASLGLPPHAHKVIAAVFAN
jgi:type IV pilus assembly protein PilV